MSGWFTPNITFTPLDLGSGGQEVTSHRTQVTKYFIKLPILKMH